MQNHYFHPFCKHRTLIGLLILLAFGLSLRTDPAHVEAAITLTVTSTADDTLANLAANTTCDLREAIEAANTNTTVGQCIHDGSAGSDTIIFDPAVTGTITLTQGQLTISGDLTITGPGSANLSISGNNTNRGFYINPGTIVTLADVTITGGFALYGGGIYVDSGTLTIRGDARISGNTAPHGSGGGIYVHLGTLILMGNVQILDNRVAYTSKGGGIYNSSGTITIQDAVVMSGNHADRGGGIFNGGHGTITIKNGVLISNNSAYNGGGGIYNEASLTIQGNAQIVGNWSGLGGGLFNRASVIIEDNVSLSNNTGRRNGGGIFSDRGDVMLRGSVQVTGNSSAINHGSSNGNGGGIFINTGTVTLDGVSVISNTAGTLGGGIFVNGTGSLMLQGGTSVSGNSIVDPHYGWAYGGGIYISGGMVTLDGSSVTGNTALHGGGIFNFRGALTIQTGAAVSNNTAVVHGGGIRNIGGTVIVDGASITNNTAYRGGGIFNQLGSFSLQNNASVSNNTASDKGGGIFNFDTGTLTIQGSTVNGNTATNEGGGLFNLLGMVTLQNGAVIAGNTGSRGGGMFNYLGQITGTGSVITGNLISTRAGGAWFEVPGTAASSLTGSCINGNDAWAVYVKAGELTATNNWWGAADGPGPVGPGSGDQIGAGVLYDPFLTAAPAGLDCTTSPVIVLPEVSYQDPNSGAGSEQTGPSAADHARAQAPLCADLDGTMSSIVRADVPGGTVTEGSVFCRVIAENGTFRLSENVAEIGVPGVLERGVLQAVDVFGLRHDGSAQAVFNTGVGVCLQGTGALLYLDATVAPRVVIELPTWANEGYTCATIPNAGTVVLVSGASSQVVPPPLSTGAETALSGCMVTTKNLMNLRSGPDSNSDIIRQIPYDVKLTAFARAGEWFQVDYLGTVGWLSAAYVTPDGVCGS